LGNWFPKEAGVEFGDLFKADKRELINLFSGYDAMVYALEPDDRVKPKAPAYDFFHDKLVESCGRIVAAAREAGVKKTVVLNSYFAYFDRTRPEMNLSKHNTYIKCRVEQEERALAESKDRMSVVILERRSGSRCCREGHGKRCPVGDVNLSWNDMLDIMLHELDLNYKKIKNLPLFFANLYGKKMKKKNVTDGIEAGLDPVYMFRDIQYRFLYLDPSDSAEELGYGRGALKELSEGL